MSKTPPAFEDIRKRTGASSFDECLGDDNSGNATFSGLSQPWECSIMSPHWLNGLLDLRLACYFRHGSQVQLTIWARWADLEAGLRQLMALLIPFSAFNWQISYKVALFKLQLLLEHRPGTKPAVPNITYCMVGLIQVTLTMVVPNELYWTLFSNCVKQL